MTEAAVELDSIIAEFRSITERGYGQFCGLARAMEVVAERWGPLILRDLFVGPRTRADLRHGLPRIPSGVLGTRLHEFVRYGIVSEQDGPDGEVEYHLTAYGRELDEVLLAFGRWGARLLDVPRPGEIVTAAGVVTALRATFDPVAARGVTASFEIRMADEFCQLRVENGVLRATDEPLPDADLLLRPGTALKSLLSRTLDPAEALASGRVSITGDPALLTTFTELFHF
ncbi:MAG TPA: winged helix-turn-helix transcriptional regulator [Pseudonocardiaceae bacterium]|nr:winged helix-turn-helix transcriptional regulator [Pseudonocardiaceae bacterium]